MAEITEKQNTGTLSEEQKKKAVSWLNEKLENDPKCPICAQSNWLIGDLSGTGASVKCYLGWERVTLDRNYMQELWQHSVPKHAHHGVWVEKKPSEEESDG